MNLFRNVLRKLGGLRLAAYPLTAKKKLPKIEKREKENRKKDGKKLKGSFQSSKSKTSSSVFVEESKSVEYSLAIT